MLLYLHEPLGCVGVLGGFQDVCFVAAGQAFKGKLKMVGEYQTKWRRKSKKRWPAVALAFAIVVLVILGLLIVWIADTPGELG